MNGKACPQLTSYYGSVVFGTKLWIAMEYLDGGSVLDKVRVMLVFVHLLLFLLIVVLMLFVVTLQIKMLGGKLSEAQIAVVVREVLLGLHYLSMEGKIHRDIKGALPLRTCDFVLNATCPVCSGQCVNIKGRPSKTGRLWRLRAAHGAFAFRFAVE